MTDEVDLKQNAAMVRAVCPRDFVGRRSELKVLEQRYASPRSEMVPVYGRRRVGKTELLLRFASDKPTVLLIASDKLRTSQIADFMRAAILFVRKKSRAELPQSVVYDLAALYERQ